MENQIDSIHQKALIRYLMYVEKTNNLVMDNKRWQKKVERRNRKMTIEDVIKKTFLPLGSIEVYNGAFELYFTKWKVRTQRFA